jgi:hypothetical protein
MDHQVTQRTVLRTAALAGAAAAVSSVLPAAPASAAEGRMPKRPATSGWATVAWE